MKTFEQYLKENVKEKYDWQDGYLTLSIGNFAVLTGSEVSTDFIKQEDPEINYDDIRGDWLFRIESVDVEPEYRGKGYAHQLLKHVIEWAKKMKFSGIILNASPSGYPKVSLEQLIYLYSKFGFEEILAQGANMIMYLGLK